MLNVGYKMIIVVSGDRTKLSASRISVTFLSFPGSFEVSLSFSWSSLMRRVKPQRVGLGRWNSWDEATHLVPLCSAMYTALLDTLGAAERKA